MPMASLFVWHIMSQHPHIEALWNAYGPTECTVMSNEHLFQLLPNGMTNFNQHVPIGRPNFNQTCYILNEAQEPLPAGVSGELYLGGPKVNDLVLCYMPYA